MKPAPSREHDRAAGPASAPRSGGEVPWWADLGPDDGPWEVDPFDPDNAPPGGDEAFLADLPADLAEEFLRSPWNGEDEVIGAGFLHHGAGRKGTGFAAGGVLDQLEPGPALTGFLRDAAADHAGLAGLGESELIGFLCAARRVASWAAAQEVEAVITLCRRRAAQAREHQNKYLIEHVSGEVAAALTLTQRAGSRLVEIAGLLERLPAVRGALAAGMIDWARAVVFAEELAACDDETSRKIVERILPQAGGMTTGQLRRALRRQVQLADPDAARRRREQGRKSAAVHRWDEPSGNCALAGREMTPADAIAADARLTAQATWLREHGATGTLDQLRCAVFSAVLNGRDISGLLPASSDPLTSESPATDDSVPGGGEQASDARPGQADREDSGAAFTWPKLSGTVNLTMPLSAWLGVTDRPGEVAGPGTTDADTCRDLATWLAAHPGTRWCLTLTDRDGRAVGHACARHGPPVPARATGPPSSNGPPGPADLDAATRWLAGLRPAWLESETCSHQRESPGYRPPPSLRHLIRIRQRTCGEPGCLRPAERADLDHTIAYEGGGRTCECNLAPVCRHGHRAKQAPGWHLEQPEPGVLVWTMPSGRTYTTRPDPYPV